MSFLRRLALLACLLSLGACASTGTVGRAPHAFHRPVFGILAPVNCIVSNSTPCNSTSNPGNGTQGMPAWQAFGTVNNDLAQLFGSVNAQTGTTYTFLSTDDWKLDTFNNASSIAATLPAATTSGFGIGFTVRVEDLGAGSVTVTPAAIAVPVQNAPATSTTGGTLAAGTYYYVVTALNANGQTIKSNEQSIATTGTTSSNTITWGSVTGATGYEIYRGTATGAENVYYTVGAAVTFTDTGAAGTSGSPPGTNTAVLSLINGATSLTIAQNRGCEVTSDGTNYQVFACNAIGSMTWPAAAGIPCYSGSSSWCTSYGSSNPIPANDVATIPSTQVSGLGTFATANAAAPPAIGGTTPAAGSFTTLSSSGGTTNTAAGAASTSAATYTGAIYSGGTGTTTYPYIYINQGAPVSTWNLQGTEVGGNAENGFTGNLFDFHVNGGPSVAALDYQGHLTVASCTGCGSGTSVTLQTNGTNNSSQTTLNMQSGSGVIVSNPSSGNVTISTTQALNAQTGTTYTIASTDSGKLVTFSNAAAVAVTLPQAMGSFAAGFALTVQNLGAGLVTITPTTSTINGAATLKIPQNMGCSIVSDSTNYQVATCSALLADWLNAASSGTSVTPICVPNVRLTVTTVTATGNFTINAPTGCSEGQGIMLKIAYTASDTYAWNAAYHANASNPGALPTATGGTSGVDFFSFYDDAANSRFDYLAGGVAY